MSPIPEMDYSLLYHERVVRSVANNTRQDGEDFWRVAAAIPIRTKVQVFPARRGQPRAERAQGRSGAWRGGHRDLRLRAAQCVVNFRCRHFTLE